ncbi:SLOG family protein [Streptomyces sp. NPDC002057]|uniref:SLOG family protein n=1 Tax=Streptomyces sp. NPDC002057 TaxID=3154664 RepID=UPI003331B0AE
MAATSYRILATGSRDWTDTDAVREALDDIYVLTPHSRLLVVVHGACPTGADAIASAWVREQRRPWFVTEEPHPARGHPTQDFGPWPGAGPRRNGFMVGIGADACLAFIGPCTSPRCRRTDPHPSHGATGCADLAEAAGTPTQRYYA